MWWHFDAREPAGATGAGRMRLTRSTGRSPTDLGSHHDQDHDRTNRSDNDHADDDRAVLHADHRIGVDGSRAHYHNDASEHADFDRHDLERLKFITTMVASLK